MAISTSCPRCRTSYNLPESQDGKRVRCRECANTFLVTGSADVPTLEEARPEDLAPWRETRVRREIDDDPRPRRDRYEDDEPRRSGGGSGLGLILAVGGAFGLLLVVGGGLAWFFASAGSPEPQAVNNPPVVPQPRPEPQPQPQPQPQPKDVKPVVPFEDPNAPPKDLAGALAMLRDASPFKKRTAAEWLKTAPVEAAKRAEVAEALNAALDEHAARREALAAAAKWGGKENLDKLAQLTDDPDGSVWTAAAEILVKLKEPEAVAKQLAGFGRTAQAARVLRGCPGGAAEKYVVKYLHHPEANVREEAAKLLTHYGTTNAVLLAQTNADLESADVRVKRAASEWLTKQRPVGVGSDKTAVALGALLTDTDRGVQRNALKALEAWATKDNVPALCEALKSDDQRAAAVKILGRLKDDDSITPLMYVLNSPERDAIARVLIAFGAKAEKATHVQLTNGDAATRRVAMIILSEIGTKESVKVLTDWAKKDKVNRDVANEALKKIRERTK